MPGHDARAQARHVVNGAIIVFFWIAVVAVVAYAYYPREQAQVLLNAAMSDSLAVSGTVVVEGRPVQNGYVHIVVNDGVEDRYLTSQVVPIEGGSGTFRQDALTLPSALQPNAPLEIIASYTGELKTGNDAVPVSGTASAHLNMADPFDFGLVARLGGLTLVLVLMLIVLFTGELTAPKARALFAATYLLTFLSLAIPIGIAVMLTNHQEIVERMKRLPIGLVMATTENVRDEQWMLNIGGVVVERAAPSTDAAVAADPANPAARPAAPELQIVGGLAVPFYLLMLAMLGAGINMTRQVPKVQTLYDQNITPHREGFFIATLSAPFQYRAVVEKEERPAAAQIRKLLIDNYMHLLAAPFIAIAVYYLLQIIANDTAEPVLVLMAFATGLVSDSIISGITVYAERTLARVLGGKSDKPHKKTTDEKADDEGHLQVLRERAAAASTAGAPSVLPELPGSGGEAEADRVVTAFIAKVEGKRNAVEAFRETGSDNGAGATGRAESPTTDQQPAEPVARPNGERSGSAADTERQEPL